MKSAFEEHIAFKKKDAEAPELPTPSTRRKLASGRGARSANLPNMFQQQEKREQDLQRQKSTGANKETVPVDKKLFTHFLDKFEDERTRQEAKGQIQKLTFKQKEKKASWAQREEEKRRRLAEEEEERRLQAQRQKEEEERRRRSAAEEAERKRREAEEREVELKRKAEAEEAEREKKLQETNSKVT